MVAVSEHDAVIVGAGTAGCYAAAPLADAGHDVCVLERKSADEAGHIACGDALKGADTFPDAIPKSRIEPTMTNTGVDHGRFEIPQHDTVLDIPVPGELAVIDRWAYGRAIIEAADDAGASFHYDTVVRDVIQPNGTIEGVNAVDRSDAGGDSGSSRSAGEGKRDDGERIDYRAPITIDAAGALSVLQDQAELDGATFDTNVSYSQFCSAYREIVEVEEPVPWDDALVFKPTERAAGYLWYFPRTETEINAGLGFQMTEPPMRLVESLKRDLRDRPEFENATVTDKLGAALPTRRPYDSAVAPGLIAAGDAAGHVNPTTGGGIAGAAYAGTYAAEAAERAIEAGGADESLLWEYNQQVMDHFGGRYAGLDVYNVFTTAVEPDDLMGLLAALPGEELSEALYAGTTSIGWRTKLRTAIQALGHLGLVTDLYRTKRLADRLIDHYEEYPEDPADYDDWVADRDAIMDEVYAVTGADPKY
jgi:digeranylgeranylglycerophospholipid reductase